MNFALALPLFSPEVAPFRDLIECCSPTLVYLLSAGTSKEPKSSCARVQGAKAAYVLTAMICHAHKARGLTGSSVSRPIPAGSVYPGFSVAPERTESIKFHYCHRRTCLKPKGIYKPNPFPFGALDQVHDQRAHLLHSRFNGRLG